MGRRRMKRRMRLKTQQLLYYFQPGLLKAMTVDHTAIDNRSKNSVHQMCRMRTQYDVNMRKQTTINGRRGNLDFAIMLAVCTSPGCDTTNVITPY
jgi:transcription elongation factor Elf1